MSVRLCSSVIPNFKRLLGWAMSPKCGKQGECSDLTSLPMALYVRITLISTDSFSVGHKTVRAGPKIVSPDQKDLKLLCPTCWVPSRNEVVLLGIFLRALPHKQSCTSGGGKKINTENKPLAIIYYSLSLKRSLEPLICHGIHADLFFRSTKGWTIEC